MASQVLNAMNEGMDLSVVMIKVLALVTTIFAVTGFVICLVSIAWLCLEEKRRSRTAPRMPRRGSLTSGSLTSVPLPSEAPDAWRRPQTVLTTQVRAPFVSRFADARGMVCGCEFQARAVSTPQAQARRRFLLSGYAEQYRRN